MGIETAKKVNQSFVLGIPTENFDAPQQTAPEQSIGATASGISVKDAGRVLGALAVSSYIGGAAAISDEDLASFTRVAGLGLGIPLVSIAIMTLGLCIPVCLRKCKNVIVENAKDLHRAATAGKTLRSHFTEPDITDEDQVQFVEPADQVISPHPLLNEYPTNYGAANTTHVNIRHDSVHFHFEKGEEDDNPGDFVAVNIDEDAAFNQFVSINADDYATKLIKSRISADSEDDHVRALSSPAIFTTPGGHVVHLVEPRPYTEYVTAVHEEIGSLEHSIN